jgi:hypothetical protein
VKIQRWEKMEERRYKETKLINHLILLSMFSVRVCQLVWRILKIMMNL